MFCFAFFGNFTYTSSILTSGKNMEQLLASLPFIIGSCGTMGLDLTLEDRLEEMTIKQWVSLEKRACAMIRACLVDGVLYGVLKERSPRGL